MEEIDPQPPGFLPEPEAPEVERPEPAVLPEGFDSHEQNPHELPDPIGHADPYAPETPDAPDAPLHTRADLPEPMEVVGFDPSAAPEPIDTNREQAGAPLPDAPEPHPYQPAEPPEGTDPLGRFEPSALPDAPRTIEDRPVELPEPGEGSSPASLPLPEPEDAHPYRAVETPEPPEIFVNKAKFIDKASLPPIEKLTHAVYWVS